MNILASDCYISTGLLLILPAEEVGGSKCGEVFKLIRRLNANEDPILFVTLEDANDSI